MDALTAPLLSPALLSRLERMELVSRKIFRGRLKGERRSKRKGQSVEFADFRNYTPGDDLRFLDWNLYARMDKLFLKLFQEEEDLFFYAVIDGSLSMTFGNPTKLQYAKQLAAALGYIGLCRSDRVKIDFLGQSRDKPGPVLRGKGALARLTDYLDHAQPPENVTLREGVKQFCLTNRGKGIVVLLTDLMEKEGYEASLRYLLAQEYDVYVIQILSREEIEPNVTGDLRLIDAEDRDFAEITASRPLLEKYKRTLTAFLSGAKEYCTRRGIGYLMTPTDAPVDKLINGYLRQRGLVR